ncbi:2-octaprenyl-6-methoxyphenyl hydroxylase [Candidatus Curculioniphilus buchneri]|uniref:2-octaprenyl-6-methoxyphenyl hydroxylase n=1 Tax=Candidatus Curculioniphilus buchneri TaxID=690594 RepID=UPI00376EAD57
MTITIIGGGIIGATLALALSRFSQGTMKINLVEMQALENNDHPSFEVGSIALAYGTCSELNTIGIWDTLSSYTTPIHRVEVSEKSNINKVHISASDYHLPALGYVIKMHDFKKLLFKLLQQASGIFLHCPAQLTNISREQTRTIIKLNNGKLFNAQLVAAADGSQSSVATLCGIHWQEKDYQQTAVIANINTELPHKGNSFECFTTYGPIAMLPISGGYSALIWCIPTKYRAEISLWNEIEFCQALQLAFGWRLGHIISTSQRKYYPLCLKIAKRHITHRLALVGNAAQTLHPIAAQGFNLGIRDVMTLAEILSNTAIQGKDIGNYDILLNYQQRRRLDQSSTVAVTDGLIRLFSSIHFPFIVSRNLGLLAMAHIPPLRDILVHKMLGWISR